MKKIITLLFFISSLCLHAQKPDSIVITTKDTTIHVNILTKTVYKFVGATPVTGTTVTPVNTGLFRGMYVGGAAAKISNSTKRNMLINYCLQDNVKVNALAPYGFDGMLGNATNENLISDFINQCHAKNIDVGLVCTNGAGFQKLVAYSETHTGQFDFTLRENEVWNMAAADQLAGLIADSNSAVIQKSISINLGIDYSSYIGWDAVNGRFLKMIAYTSDVLFIHVYRTNPLDIAYAKTRLDNWNVYLKGLGRNPAAIIITSDEPAFDQLWQKTHSLDEIDNYFKPLINAYSNIHYGGQMKFDDDFTMISIPYKMPTFAFAARLTNYSGNEFKNENILQHIIDSVDPNDK